MKCQILNLPAELAETPVLGYGLEQYINYRLETDFDHCKRIEITAATHISLAGKDDLNLMRVENIARSQYRLMLEGTDSFFIFPFRPELISQKVNIKPGMVLSDSLSTVRIDQLNQENNATGLTVTLPADIPAVLYFSEGKLGVYP